MTMCNEDCMVAVENCKDHLADWSRRTPLKQQIRFGLLFVLVIGGTLSIILVICHHMFWKERPRFEGERFMLCEPSGYTSEMYAQQSKRIYDFDEFLQTKRVRANSDRLDTSAWRSVYDAIRYVQDLYDDTQQWRIIDEINQSNKEKAKQGQPTMATPAEYGWKILNPNKRTHSGVRVGYPVADILERHYEFECSGSGNIQSYSLLVLALFALCIQLISPL